ncbi:general transcription factor II-I repeat domain-containing protein 2B-like [Watersipora subatra]|uniref:general transcription factor II-I repeat domain-containing protein 2B-like n=1 Tax=Watersipora subatra TaxID=2589382 RepID=UPI00355AFE37
MTPVVRNMNSICSKVKQRRMFKMLLDKLSGEYGDFLLHIEIRWLSRGKILQRFMLLLSKIKQFMLSKKEDASLLDDPEWLFDLTFLTDLTKKLNHLNRELQGKDMTIAHVVSAVNAFKAKKNIFAAQVKRKKFCIFRLCRQC